MTGEPKIGVVHPQDSLSTADQPVFEPAPASPLPQAYPGEPQPASRPGGPIAWAAALALIGWTVFFVWSHAGAMAAGADPDHWSAWISGWATPALLIGMAWLIAARISPRQSRRFADTAAMLQAAAGAVEARVAAMNRELSLAREFVAAQARDLDSLGRIATERLTGHAERLQALVRANGADVEAIATVSTAALDNMERLRGQLPVLTSAAKDLTNNLANASRAAQSGMGELSAEFARLAAQGQDSERLVAALRGQFDTAMGSFAAQTGDLDRSISDRAEQMAAQARQFHQALAEQQGDFDTQLRAHADALTGEIEQTRDRLAAGEAESITSLRARLSALRDEAGAMARALRDGESAALAAWREASARLTEDISRADEAASAIGSQAAATSNTRMARLAEEAAALDRVLSETGARLEAETTRRRHAAEAQDRSLVERLAAHLAMLDGEIERRQAVQAGHFANLADQGQATIGRMGEIERRLAAIAQGNGAAQAGMAQHFATLDQRLSDGRAALDTSHHQLAALTASSALLLDLVRQIAGQAREELGQALELSGLRLADLEERSLTLRELVIDADRSGALLSAHLDDSHERLDQATAGLVARHDAIAARAQNEADQLGGLQQQLVALDAHAQAAAERIEGDLAQAIRQLSAAADAAVNEIEGRGTVAVSALAGHLGTQSGEALDRAMRLAVAEIFGKLEQAAAHAAGISREAAGQLRGEIAQVDGLVGKLEARLDTARARARQSVDDDFARRVALITEALNSNAIDIARALDTDVGDTAWAAYLRGDRGVFTRRAVRLLDPSQARAIQALYQQNADFHEHVSAYIHDFEAMLRQLLATRDGHAMGVTLLSADMGKLYVMLAQAIERLRN